MKLFSLEDRNSNLYLISKHVEKNIVYPLRSGLIDRIYFFCFMLVNVNRIVWLFV